MMCYKEPQTGKLDAQVSRLRKSYVSITFNVEFMKMGTGGVVLIFTLLVGWRI